MPTHRIVPSVAAAVGFTMVMQSAVLAQEHRGTPEQQMACTPDVFRLCGAEIPDENRIVGCLRQNIALLSRPCRAVLEPNSGGPQQASPQQIVPRGRPMQPPPYYAQPGQDDDDD
ncbi:hypothetical protein [Bradyrhizobium canariense]|uniref:Cysteine rich repeat-containing protein n=1 Tax=Bradyrhizobium canariense TaxID=255045 RepID=A0A1H1W970_9BRAD|nr:hypothetical protein [Bradyrhizobium canariense]SDS93757.1 hypothetical protein SAMN05444158_3750 [Bradyrhizobium canariense]